MYTIDFVQDVMREYSLVIRAIPNKDRHVYEKEHIDMYPNGTIEMLGKPFNREMLVVENIPEHAGEFVIGFAKHTLSGVSFIKNRYFKNIDEIIDFVLHEYDPNTEK